MVWYGMVWYGMVWIWYDICHCKSIPIFSGNRELRRSKEQKCEKCLANGITTNYIWKGISISIDFISFQFISFHFISFHFISFHFALERNCSIQWLQNIFCLKTIQNGKPDSNRNKRIASPRYILGKRNWRWSCDGLKITIRLTNYPAICFNVLLRS